MKMASMDDWPPVRFAAVSIIGDVFGTVYQETGDPRCIEAAEEATMQYIEGRLTADSLPDWIAGAVAGIRRNQ